jgi:transposase-like protein
MAKKNGVERWTARRKAELVLQLIKGEVKLVDVCRQHDLKQSTVEKWIETFMKAGHDGLRVNAKDAQAAHN